MEDANGLEAKVAVVPAATSFSTIKVEADRALSGFVPKNCRYAQLLWLGLVFANVFVRQTYSIWDIQVRILMRSFFQSGFLAFVAFVAFEIFVFSAS